MDVPKLRISSMWTRRNSTIFLLLLSCPLILIFLSACSKGPSEEDCPRYTVMTEKGVEVKLKPGAKAKLTGVSGFVTGAIGYTEEKKLADTDRVLLRLDAYQHRYCVLAYKAGQNAKKAKTEEERQKYLAEQGEMWNKSLEAFEDLRTLALKYDEVKKGTATTAQFTGAVNELKAEIAKFGEEIKEDKVLRKEFKKIDEKIEKRPPRVPITATTTEASTEELSLEGLHTVDWVVEGGYESVTVNVDAYNTNIQIIINGRSMAPWPTTADVFLLQPKIQLIVNGRVVGKYPDKYKYDYYLDSFLKRGEVNTVSFVYSAPNPNRYNRVRMYVKSPGTDSWTEIYNFMPTEGQLGQNVKLLFVGTAE